MREFEERHGVTTRHGWGMTESSPLGSVNVPVEDPSSLSERERDEQRVKQGRALFGVDFKIVDDANRELPWDGKAFGDLKIRGYWVCDGYFNVR